MTEKITLPNPHEVVEQNKGGRPRGSRGAQQKSIVKYPLIVDGMLSGKSNEEIGRELGYGGDYPDQSIYHITKHHDFQAYLAHVLTTQTDKIFTRIEALWNSESKLDKRTSVKYLIDMFKTLYPKVNLSYIEKRNIEENRTENREKMRELLNILSDEQKQEYMRKLQDMANNR